MQKQKNDLQRQFMQQQIEKLELEKELISYKMAYYNDRNLVEATQQSNEQQDFCLDKIATATTTKDS